ncbi:MAG: salicylate 1-monooxygenase [Betaproteobacteria bacterium]|nr:MAG: salicylate 1-monooxygenase [Betaproteobacteria bacterium]
MSKPPSVAVVGAGIGGLAVAALLKRAGYDVQVYEQARRFERVGAGIQMTPNAVKVLRRLGVEEQLRQVAFRSIESAVPPEIVHFDMRLVGLDRNAGAVALAFADGSRVLADAVIGADGVHSVVRELLLGPEKPRFTGRVAYRALFPAARLGDTRLAPVQTKWWGPDRHVVIYYVTAARDQIYFVTSVPEGAEWMTRESWSAKGDLDELRKAYSGFHAEVRAVLDACPGVYKWALLERDPLPRWSEGPVVLLGDACHPMTPYMAQGAAAALEDAAVLARCLEATGGEGLEQALKLYEETRKPRTSAIQAKSSTNTWMRTDADPGWVYGYDAWSAPLGVDELQDNRSGTGNRRGL